MKKILLLGLMVTLFAFVADAQTARRSSDRMKRSKEFNKEAKFHRFDKKQHHKGSVKYHEAKKKFMRDGKLTKAERRSLDKLRKENRKHVARYKHSPRKRVI